MQYWFMGCPHFNHKRIIELANRPFANVEEMNEALVSRWNQVVGQEDHTYLLGDICWPTSPEIKDSNPHLWLEKLNGSKTVIKGNHDSVRYIDENQFRYGYDDYLEIEIQKQKLVLFHYPIEDWNKRWQGSIHLHAHDHLTEFLNPNLPVEVESGLDLGNSRFPKNMRCNRFRVGADAINFTPVSFNMIMEAAYTPED